MSSSPAALLLLFVFALDLKTERCSAARIGLFGSSGCYSHDVTMRAAGEVFRGHDVAWVQTFTFDFGVPAPTLPSNWHRMIVNQVSEDSTAALHYTKSIIWETVVPMDVRRLWDLRPQWAIFNILRTQHMACYATLRSANFTTFLQQHGNLDLAVVDYMLQECMVGTSALFNATVSVYFSNWPLSDGYVASFNIPWMPSTVAKTSSGLPTHMNFAERTANMVVQIFFLLSHSLQIAVVDVLHSWVGYESDILATESRQLLYATHSEFVIEMTRPISNQIKFFGCQRCLPSDPAKATRRSAEIQTDQLLTLPSSSSSSITTTPSSFTDVGGIDRHLLLRPFIVVTFGSISSVQTMGAHLLHDFMRAFGALNHTVFWQFDGVPPADQRIPENVHLISWLPLKELFEHPNMRLLVCHGGITTLMEAVHRAIPILGLPLQGDQPTNLRRFQELGISELVFTNVLSAETLLTALNKMLVNLKSYEARALKVSSMVRDYQDFTGDGQAFWLQWALRNGATAQSRNYFSTRYRFAWTYYQMPELLSLFAIVALCWLLVASDDQLDQSACRSPISFRRIFPELSVHFDDSRSLAIDESPLMCR